MNNPEKIDNSGGFEQQFAEASLIEPLPDADISDGVTEGLAQTDTSYILHESYDRIASPFENAPTANMYIEKNPKAAKLFGFEVIKGKESFFFVSPRAQRLNEIKEGMPKELGLNTATFVEIT